MLESSCVMLCLLGEEFGKFHKKKLTINSITKEKIFLFQLFFVKIFQLFFFFSPTFFWLIRVNSKSHLFLTSFMINQRNGDSKITDQFLFGEKNSFISIFIFDSFFFFSYQHNKLRLRKNQAILY